MHIEPVPTSSPAHDARERRWVPGRRVVAWLAVVAASLSMFVLVSSPAGADGNGYVAKVTADGATHLWRLGEASGTTGYDAIGSSNLVERFGVIQGAAGAIVGDTDTATRFAGTSSSSAYDPDYMYSPNQYTLSTWIKTTTTTGGKIIGFGSTPGGGTDGTYDRHVYMDNSGRINYGVLGNYYDPNANVVTSPSAYNDGQWHQVIATLSSAGMYLYVDGALVGSHPQITHGENQFGYWNIGGDSVNGWPNAPTSMWFRGTIDEVAIYPTALTLAKVRGQYLASGRTLAPAPPTAVIAEPSCTYLACSFDGTGSSADGSITSYAWDFGDGTTGTSATPQHTYATDGTYHVSLTVTDDQGATSPEATKDVVVAAPPNQAPIAVIATPSCSYLTCSFDGTSSTDDGTVASYAWDFGDGTTSTQAKPTHTYANADTYTVTLTVTDDQGVDSAPATASAGTVADQAPSAQISFAGCGYQHCIFDGSTSSDPDGTVASYAWDFGDGTSGTDAKPQHTYTNAGTYVVSLVVTDDQGVQSGASTTTITTWEAPVARSAAPSCSYLNCSFDGSASTQHDARGVASYKWDFGDGTTSTAAAPSHTYTADGTYQVTLVVTDDLGQPSYNDATRTVVVAANKAPTATIAAGPCRYLSCTFDGSASVDSDGSLASYAWTFGDGTSSTVVKPSHRYTRAGTYQVTLTVTDDQGATNRTTISVAVKADIAPTAVIAAPSCTYLTCLLDGSQSSDVDGTVDFYEWDFGDGTSGPGATPMHTYAKAGTYKVTLYVVDDNDTKSAVVTRSVTVKANVKPTAAFAGTCTYLACSFDASTSKDTDGTITSYAWDFGDGSTGSGVNPQHTYAKNSTYKVVLVVTDNAGAAGTAVTKYFTVKANVKPTAAFTSSCTARVCSFDGSTSTDPDGRIASYSWTFGDGGVDTTASPSHTYAKAGRYTVALTVTDDAGASTTKQTSITVTAPNLPPTATFSSAGTGLTGTFDAHNSSDSDGSIVAYRWSYGDGTTGTGVTPKHAYVGSGTYTIVLTVTDDGGATATATGTLTVIPASAKLLVSDYFDRTVTDGWGTPTVGGAYSLGSAGDRFSVDGSTGRFLVPANQFVQANPSPLLTLNSTQVIDLSVDQLPANGVYVYLTARRTVGGGYREKLFISGTGAVTIMLTKVGGGTNETVLQSAPVPGLTVTPGLTLRLRFVTTGSGTTTLTGKVWDASKAEPASPLVSTTDSTPGDLQKAAGFGITATTNGTNATGSTVVRFDNLVLSTP